jgi:hypothetical protein
MLSGLAASVISLNVLADEANSTKPQPTNWIATLQNVSIAYVYAPAAQGDSILYVFLRNDTSNPINHLRLGRDSGFKITHLEEDTPKPLRPEEPDISGPTITISPQEVKSYRILLRQGDVSLLKGKQVTISTRIYDPATQKASTISSSPAVIIQ